MNRKRIVLIPAYEPDEKMMLLLEELYERGYEIIVVNDGSICMWDDLFMQAGIFATVLTHRRNQGKGAALKTGFQYIADTYDPDSIVVTADADGQHLPMDIDRVCAAAKEHPEALILGSRNFTEDTPPRSRFGNTVTRLVYRLFTGQKVADTQTGLRACCARQIPVMCSISGERYEYEMNVLMYCAGNRIPIIEVPIETVYHDGNAGSHFDALKDSARIYREILKFSAVSFLSFILDYAAYLTLITTGTGLAAANVLARLLSASFNFAVNRRIVFQSETKLFPSLLKYVVLAGGVLILNTVMLEFLTSIAGIGAIAAKPLVEAILFVFNFGIQRSVIFRKKSGVRQGKRYIEGEAVIL